MVGKKQSRIPSNRLRALTDEAVMDEQSGLRAGRGCVDQFFAVMQVIEVIEKDEVASAALVNPNPPP